MANKGVGKKALPWMYLILVDRPNGKVRYSVSKGKKATMRLDDAIEMIEKNPQPAGWKSLRDTAMKAFLAEVDSQGGKDAQVAYCRAALQPERKTYFRQLAAMDRLVALLGADATTDLAPYLSHDHLRFQDHSRALMLKLKGDKVSGTLVSLAGSDKETVAAAALTMLGARGDKDGVKVGLKHITSHKSGLVRGAAAEAIYGGSNGDAMDKLLSNIKNVKDALELEGYEAALLLRRSEPAKAKATADAIRKTIPGCSIPVRRSLYYVLGQLGGSTNLNYLASRVGTKDEAEFANVVEAISWSPDVSATNLLIKILKNHQGTPRAFKVSDLSVKRVINGAEELGKVPDKANLDFATEHLKVVRNLGLLDYLGSIHNVRCMSLLYKYMKLGPSEVTARAAQSIIRSASGISKEDPLAKRKAAAEILASVVEYVNVIYNRKDVEDLGRRRREISTYMKWKKIGDRAGVVIKRIYDPKEESIDAGTGIDEDDLEL